MQTIPNFIFTLRIVTTHANKTHPAAIRGCLTVNSNPSKKKTKPNPGAVTRAEGAIFAIHSPD